MTLGTIGADPTPPARSECAATGSRSGPRCDGPEDAVQAGEELFRGAFEHTNVAMVLTDLDNRFLRVNGAFARLFGYTDAELLAMGMADVTHPDHLAESLTLRKALLDGSANHFVMEKRYLHRDGHVLWGLTNVSLVRDAAGRPVRYVGQIQDITQRVVAEAEIRRLNADLERAVRERTAELYEAQRLARVGSWVLHLDVDRSEWTPELYRLFGLDPNSPIPPFAERRRFYPAESWARLNAVIATAVRTGGPFEMEVAYRRPDGTAGTLKSSGEAERDGTGRVVRLRGTAQDITELRRVEESLRRESERLLLATRAGNVGIWDWDLAVDSLHWDAEMYAMYGIPPERYDEPYRTRLACVHPDDRDRTDGEIQTALRGGAEFRSQFRIVRPDGSVRHIQAHSVVHRNAAGDPVRMVGTNWDITAKMESRNAIRALNEDLTRRNAQVIEANKELEAFAYSVSHDLRAPLRALDGFSRIVLDDFAAALPAEAQDYLRDIRRNAQRMGRLVDDLLAFSRLGRHAVQRKALAVHDLVRQCAAEVAAGSAAEFRLADLPPCVGDPALLKQVWLNLLGNAVKYSARSTPPVVEIGSAGTPEEPVYFVRDNGVGFDMRYAGKLFGVFQRLHRQEDYEGTGVGLAIVQRIVHRHGGRVWAEAEPGRGATFFFSLPTAAGGSAHDSTC